MRGQHGNPRLRGPRNAVHLSRNSAPTALSEAPSAHTAESSPLPGGPSGHHVAGVPSQDPRYETNPLTTRFHSGVNQNFPKPSGHSPTTSDDGNARRRRPATSLPTHPDPTIAVDAGPQRNRERPSYRSTLRNSCRKPSSRTWTGITAQK